MNIAIFIDSYKGTLSSLELSRMIEEHLARNGHDHVVSVPVSDGGEGFIESVEGMFPSSTRVAEAVDPFGNPIDAKYVLKDRTAYIGLYTAAGIALVPESELSPSKTSTYGVGMIIRDAISKGARKIVLGIGGSATNDGGAGMLQALGMRFHGANGEITEPMNGFTIGKVRSIDPGNLESLTEDVEFLLVSDVATPLLGEYGSVNMFSDQKGSSPDERDILEKAMAHYASVVEDHIGHRLRDVPSAGAAGGVGFGVMAFLDTKVELGIEYLIDLFDIKTLIKKSDVVIIGEGRFDRQTIHGKAPYGIAKLAKRYGKHVVGLFGTIENGLKQDYIDEIHVISPDYVSKEESLSQPKASFKKMLSNVNLDRFEGKRRRL